MNSLPVTVRCPSCSTDFPVDPLKIPRGGVNAICSECQHVFLVEEAGASGSATPSGVASDAGGAPNGGALPHDPADPPSEPEGDVQVSGGNGEPRLEGPRPGAPSHSVPGGGGEPEGEAGEEWSGFHELSFEPEEAEPTSASNTASGMEVPPEVDATSEVDSAAALEADSALELESDPASVAENAPADAIDAVESPAEDDDAEAGDAGEAPSTRDDAGPPAGDAPAATFGRRDPHERAARLARVLASDIIAYNQEKYERASEAGTLASEFEEEVEKSWEEYTEQVGKEMAEGNSYFRDALNEILARGEKIF